MGRNYCPTVEGNTSGFVNGWIIRAGSKDGSALADYMLTGASDSMRNELHIMFGQNKQIKTLN